MATKVQDLKKKAKTLADEIRKRGDEFNADGFEPTAEWNEQWDKLNGDYDEVRKQLEVSERAEKVQRETETRQDPARRAIGRPMPSSHERRDASEQVEQRNRAFAGWVRGGDPEDVEAAQAAGFTDQRSCTMPLFGTGEFRSMQSALRAGHPSGFETRAQSALTGSLGGFTIAEDFVSSLELGMLAFGSMLSIASVIRSPNAAPMRWPGGDDTGETGELLGEAEESADGEINFEQFQMFGYKFGSKKITCPHELLSQSAFDIGGTVGGMLGERLGRRLEIEFATGSGVSRPKGILTALPASSAITPDVDNVDAADDLVDALHAVDPSYRSRARWMMHDSVLARCRKLRDTAGQPLWTSGLNSGLSDTLLGVPVSVNQSFPEYGTSMGVGTIIVGDLSLYRVRLVGSVRVLRDALITSDSEVFVAYVEADGGLWNPGGRGVKRADIEFGPIS